MSQINVAVTDNAASKIASAQPGDVVVFAAGTWTMSASVTIPSGVTLQGAPNYTSKLVFNLSGQDLYAFILPANASNILITLLSITSSNGIVRMADGAKYSNIQIIANQLTHGGGAFTSGTEVFGIYASIGGTGLQITYNDFLNCVNSNRSWEVWGQDHGNLDYNYYNNIVDGGHLMEPQANMSFSFNVGHNMRRMGQEIQGSTIGSNLMVQGNVFYDWVTPYFDSFGLSVVNDKSVGTIVQNNYIQFSIAAGSTWGIKDPNVNRFGYCIEIGGTGPEVLGNTLVVANLAGAIVDASCAALAKNNAVYYTVAPEWGIFATEPGPSGSGSYTNQATLTTDNTVVATIPTTVKPPATIAGTALYASKHGTTVTPPPVQTVPTAPVTAVTVVSGSISLKLSDGTTQSLNFVPST